MLILGIDATIINIHEVAILATILIKDLFIFRALLLLMLQLLQVLRVLVIDQILEVVLTSALPHHKYLLLVLLLSLQVITVSKVLLIVAVALGRHSMQHAAFFHDQARAHVLSLPRDAGRAFTEQVLVGLVPHRTATPWLFRFTHILFNDIVVVLIFVICILLMLQDGGEL